MKLITTAIASIVLFVACNNNAKNQNLNPSEMKVVETAITDNKFKVEEEKNGFFADSTAKPEQKNDPQKKKEPSQTQQTPNPDWDKKIIKTATLNVEAKDFKTYYTSLREKVKSFGGYVAQEDQNESDYKIENTVVIKVPVDQFDNAVTQLGIAVEKVNEKKISSQDVTAEFVDTRSRMESKKQVRLRYLDLLKQAKNMEEILSVQSEIDGIQEQIESATGRIEYLGHSSAFSTINLTYYQILNSSAKNSDNPGFVAKINSAFKMGWGWIVELFIGLISIWPLVLAIFFGIVFYKKTKVKKAGPIEVKG
jgi:Domain of unknown function (DUF4349)